MQALMNHVSGSLGVQDLVATASYYVYFKKEEFVMWKMQSMEDQNGNYDFDELRQGIIYA